jgi:acetyl esterase/lipase
LGAILEPESVILMRPTIPGRWAALSLAVGTLLPGLLAPLAAAADRSATPSFQVGEVRDVPYWESKTADAGRHKLDLYLPRTKKPFPVVVFVHGGAWVMGDKSFFGWGEDIGRYYASRGIGAVLPSYRLSPRVKHPDHVKDLARAFAWTVRHIGRYGGRPDQLYLCGHSAGGHLAALLATDDSYLKAEGVKLSSVKGVIAVSGVYRIPEINLNLKLPAWSTDILGAFGSSGKAKARVSVDIQVNLCLSPTAPIFGTDSKIIHDASPLHHVRAGLPPFLLIYSDHDLPFLPQMAQEFARKLTESKCEVSTLEAAGRDHETVMFYATVDTDPVARAIRKFVDEHGRTVRSPR